MTDSQNLKFLTHEMDTFFSVFAFLYRIIKLMLYYSLPWRRMVMPSLYSNEMALCSKSTTATFRRHTPSREFYVAVNIPYIHEYITT